MAIGGSAEIDAMFSNAHSGVFEMDAGVAQNCANAVQNLIRDLTAQRDRTNVVGFSLGDPFPSAQQMHEGFIGKLERLGTILDEYLLAAEKLRLSFLIAGRVLTEEDAQIAASFSQAEQREGAQ